MTKTAQIFFCALFAITGTMMLFAGLFVAATPIETAMCLFLEAVSVVLMLFVAYNLNR